MTSSALLVPRQVVISNTNNKLRREEDVSLLRHSSIGANTDVDSKNNASGAATSRGDYYDFLSQIYRRHSPAGSALMYCRREVPDESSLAVKSHSNNNNTSSSYNSYTNNNTNSIGNEKSSNRNNTTTRLSSNIPPPVSITSSSISATTEESNSSNKTTRNTATTRNNTTHTKRKSRKDLQGNHPNIHWRCIPMEDLRLHPNFVPLSADPPSELHSYEDLASFRQDSWQWDALHKGRCTTSRAASALGILEYKAGKELGVPVSLRKGGVYAYHHMREPALRELDEMEDVLCSNSKLHASSSSKYYWDKNVWRIKPWKKNYPFIAHYCRQLSNASFNQNNKNITSMIQARVRWGSVQEATSILTAINHFCGEDPKIKVLETGMCPGESSGFQQNLTDGLLIGASPDGVIQYPDNKLEVLEVKNHCPFYEPFGSRSKRSVVQKGKKFYVQAKGPDASIPAAYIPQLMLEMVCLGPSCRSAVMVRQTAIRGAIILRLHRDDAWIAEMIEFLNKFTEKYVRQETPPPENFFWDDDDALVRERYRAFVRRTKELCQEAEVVKFIEHKNIQRALAEDGSHRVPLFFDDN